MKFAECAKCAVRENVLVLGGYSRTDAGGMRHVCQCTLKCASKNRHTLIHAGVYMGLQSKRRGREKSRESGREEEEEEMPSSKMLTTGK